MKKYIFILLCYLCTSCAINGNGIYSNYNKIIKSNPGLLVNTDAISAICELKTTDKPRVYVINAAQLKNCMAQNENALVYIWKPKCKSQYCYPLNVIQQACNKSNADLYIVAEYYHPGLMNADYETDRPIFGINTEYYEANLVAKYRKRFLKDLTDDKIADDNYDNFMYFKHGTYMYSFSAIDSISIK